MTLPCDSTAVWAFAGPRRSTRPFRIRAGSNIEVTVPEDVRQHTFPNGLTLLAERMDHVRSAALNFLVPAGCASDPPDRLGVGAILADLITRGAGNRDSREL